MGALRARHPAEVRRGRRPAAQRGALPGVDGGQDHLREAQIRGGANQQPPQSPRRACAHRPLSRHRNRDRNNYRDRSTKAGSHPQRARIARGGCLSSRLHASTHRQQNPHPDRGRRCELPANVPRGGCAAGAARGLPVARCAPRQAQPVHRGIEAAPRALDEQRAGQRAG